MYAILAEKLLCSRIKQIGICLCSYSIKFPAYLFNLRIYHYCLSADFKVQLQSSITTHKRDLFDVGNQLSVKRQFHNNRKIGNNKDNFIHVALGRTGRNAVMHIALSTENKKKTKT